MLKSHSESNRNRNGSGLAYAAGFQIQQAIKLKGEHSAIARVFPILQLAGTLLFAAFLVQPRN